MAEQGSHEQLMAIPAGVYKRLWDAQLTENTQVGQVEIKEEKEVVVARQE